MVFGWTARKTGWCAAAVLCTSGLAFGQLAPGAEEPAEPQETQPTESTVLVGKPALKIANAEIDLGSILDVDKKKFTIEFTNAGDGVLVINRVQPSCGCTAAKPNKTEYMPGESGVVEGEYDPRGKEGPQAKTITLFTNDPETPSAVVTFKSVVEPLVKIEPKVLNFGKVDKTLGKSMFVTFTSAADGFEATMATVSDDRFQTSVVKSEEVELSGKKFRRSTVEVKLAPGATVGRGTSTVAVRTNEPRADLLNVQVVAEVTGELEVKPSPATLGNLPAGQPFESKITLRSKSGKPVKVKGVELRRPNNLGLETSIESNEYNTIHTVTIKGVAPQRSGAMQGEIAVMTEEPGEEEIKIPFYGFIRLSPAGNSQAQPPAGRPIQPAAPVQPAPSQPAQPK
jgi:hypothetical protein